MSPGIVSATPEEFGDVEYDYLEDALLAIADATSNPGAAVTCRRAQRAIKQLRGEARDVSAAVDALEVAAQALEDAMKP